MARGLPRRVVLGGNGIESVYDTYNPDVIKQVYSVSTTKLDEWDVGDVVVFPDGREFVYSKSNAAAALYAAHACEFTDTGYTAITNFAVSAAIGAYEVTVPAATHAALTTDYLRGGYIVIFDGASDYYTTVRQIIGNDSADADAAFKVYLDAPLTYAVTAGTSKCETYLNPYSALTVASNAAKPKAGVPAVYVSAAANYFWCQIKGLTWIAPHAVVGENGGLGCFFRHDGTIESADTALAVSTATADTSQYAGYVVAGSQAGNGPLFKLNG